MKADQRIEGDRQLLIEARSRGRLATLGAMIRLSGPGWLQSAITLGGGSLAGALFLGVLGGYSLLWVQLVAIVAGVIMLSAISYATLATGQRPFGAIRTHINPVLAWGWALATFAANIVWCLPQFSLATAAIEQNLMPVVTGNDPSGSLWVRGIICGAILLIATSVVFLYDSGGRGVRIFEAILKVMVAIVVLSFFGVVLKLGLSSEGLPWSQILLGFIPDFSQWSRPASTFTPYLEQVAPEFRSYWSNLIVADQRDVIITAAATAVGVNMTFLLPYSILRRGWNRDFRGLAIFDLSTGMAIPFVLVTSCVVIASASRFHVEPGKGLLDETTVASRTLAGSFDSALKSRATYELQLADQVVDDALIQETVAALPEADRRMAAMLAKRDAFDLADSLAPLTGSEFANVVFGVGVLGMGLSTIVILMLISGFVVCEMLGLPQSGWTHRIGCLVPAVGVLGPFYWSKAQVYLAVPTSVFGSMLLPVAYITFFLMMNSPRLLGEQMPRGTSRWIWNTLMLLSITAATVAASWSVYSKTGMLGGIAAAAFIGLALLVHIVRKPPQAASQTEPETA